ncbi:hypothetical protein [Streptomyces sp. NPDC005438]|uniref:hypothetical protein n=1 Tax=Streptomyces sp. NPDC005438 TaxID=3156880 RepID=UPI0033B2DE83
MPRGRYALYDSHDHSLLGYEHFHCAVGPSGWRYVSQVLSPSEEHSGSLDLTLDERGRPIRLEAHASSWRVRGAALDGVTWVRSDPAGQHGQEGNAAAHSFTGASPAFLVATALLLGPDSTAPVRTRLVELTPPVLAPRTVDQAWALLDTDTHRTDLGPLVVRHYQVSDLHTGDRHDVHLAGDVVVAAPGVELEDLESPPSALPHAGPA